MPITYIWGVPQMDCSIQHNGETNVVFTVHWTLTATGGGYTANVYGTVQVAPPMGGVFTPYEDLTLEQVIGWVKDAMGEEKVNQLEAALATQIANQIAPPIVAPPLPWA